MAALNARMQHERNYDDEKLASIGLRRLDIDPERIEWNFVLDFCCQALRHMQIGLGPGEDGWIPYEHPGQYRRILGTHGHSGGS